MYRLSSFCVHFIKEREVYKKNKKILKIKFKFVIIKSLSSNKINIILET